LIEEQRNSFLRTRSEIVIFIDRLSPLSNEILKMHWAKRRKIMQDFHYLIKQVMGFCKHAPIHKCKIHVNRYSARGRLPDRSGILGGFKLVEDVLIVKTKVNPCGLGIIQDDNPQCVLGLTADPIRCTTEEVGTEIVITNYS